MTLRQDMQQRIDEALLDKPYLMAYYNSYVESTPHANVEMRMAYLTGFFEGASWAMNEEPTQ